MKVVLATGYVAFAVSREAAEWMAALGSERAKEALKAADLYAEVASGTPWPAMFHDRMMEDIPRNDSLLLAAMETLGADVVSGKSQWGGSSAALKVVDVPDDGNWYITRPAGYAEQVVLGHGIPLATVK